MKELTQKYCVKCDMQWHADFCPIHGTPLTQSFSCPCGEDFLGNARYCVRCGKSKEEWKKELTTTPTQTETPCDPTAPTTTPKFEISENAKNNIVNK